MISIDLLTKWFDKKSELLSRQGVKFSLFIKDSGTEKPAQAFDIETQDYMARVTLWESGECDFEVIAIDTTNEDRFFAHRVVRSEVELNEFLEPHILRL